MIFYNRNISLQEFEFRPYLKIIYDKSYDTALEIFKIAVCSILLELLNRSLMGTHKQLSVKKIRVYVILAPLCEEIFFRGFMQKAIGSCLVKGSKPENETKKKILNIHRAIRVHLAALFYALLHLDLSQNDKPKYIPCIWFFLEGVNHGYLYEKYGTLCAPFINHGVSNLISVYLAKAGKTFPRSTIMTIFSIKLIIGFLFIYASKRQSNRLIRALNLIK